MCPVITPVLSNVQQPAESSSPICVWYVLLLGYSQTLVHKNVFLPLSWRDGGLMLSNFKLCCCLLSLYSIHEQYVGMVFTHHFRELAIPSLKMVVCSFVSFCVEIPYIHGDLWIITKSCLLEVIVKIYQLWKPLNRTHLHQSHPFLVDIVDGDELINAPLYCYIMK